LEQAQAKIVLSFMKDSRATISSADHMINKSSLLPARDSQHEQRLSHRRLLSQRGKSSLSPLIPPALPYMPAAAVMLVITPYVTGQKPLHETAQRLLMRSFNHKVKMIWHQRSGNLPIFFGTSDIES